MSDLTRAEYDAYCYALGAPPDSDEATLRRAWRGKAQQHHPDKGGSHEEFTALGKAWASLEEANFVRPPLPQRFQQEVDFGGLYATVTQPPDVRADITLSEVVQGCSRAFTIPRWTRCPEEAPHTTCCGGLQWIRMVDTETIVVNIPAGSGFSPDPRVPATRRAETPTRLQVQGYGAPNGRDRNPLHIGVRWNREIHATQVVTSSPGKIMGIRAQGTEIQFMVTLDLVDALLGGDLTVNTPWGVGSVQLPPPAVLLGQQEALPLDLAGLAGIPILGHPTIPSAPCRVYVSLSIGAWTSPEQRALLQQLRELRAGDSGLEGYGDESAEGREATS